MGIYRHNNVELNDLYAVYLDIGGGLCAHNRDSLA